MGQRFDQVGCGSTGLRRSLSRIRHALVRGARPPGTRGLVPRTSGPLRCGGYAQSFTDPQV